MPKFKREATTEYIRSVLNALELGNSTSFTDVTTMKVNEPYERVITLKLAVFDPDPRVNPVPSIDHPNPEQELRDDFFSGNVQHAYDYGGSIKGPATAVVVWKQ